MFRFENCLRQALRREGRQIWALDLAQTPLDEVLSTRREPEKRVGEKTNEE